ncbi:pyridoxal 5'-phosphate synthase glutaminase subunit PdxT [Corynebacterium gerontici]|uniref:Pyridoxal 5'-phosphate synthase subunit PdxT n=1 Tax=Corynebacterium gerontici TaxID=2079234 RepID=A0A3G6J2S7_9CORY|nr:pyridoxal 5'-phosphate synthase glutaminase subunit PdxT [Corynebacterium gerontici]AZA12355.1 Glutamine amidotransferase subunit PdxT [Corynebacterium gerontici]
MVIGILALQGGIEEHRAVLERLGCQVRLVRFPTDLEGLDGIVIPGGESTVMDKLARAFGLAEPLRDALKSGLPAFGTCAGLIYLAEVENPAPAQQTLAVLPVRVRRNAFGTQKDSFEQLIDGQPATFIRAPEVVAAGDAEVIARLADGRIVGVRHGRNVAYSFHPEENGRTDLHEQWLRNLRGEKHV